jgi:hypothetical protein
MALKPMMVMSGSPSERQPELQEAPHPLIVPLRRRGDLDRFDR